VMKGFLPSSFLGDILMRGRLVSSDLLAIIDRLRPVVLWLDEELAASVRGLLRFSFQL